MNLKVKIEDLEKSISLSIKRNQKVIGLDTASRTGVCKLTTDNDYLYLDYTFVSIKTSDVYFKYNEIIEIFNEIIEKDYYIVIEDTFYRFNPKMFRLISRIGAIAYTLAHLKGCEVIYLLATSARKKLGIKGNCKKDEVAKYLVNTFNLEIKDNDIADAIVLAICGVLE